MESINLATAKAHLSQIIDRVELGESVAIIRRGKLAATLGPPRHVKAAIPLELLRKLTASQSPSKSVAGSTVRKMRDTDRY